MKCPFYQKLMLFLFFGFAASACGEEDGGQPVASGGERFGVVRTDFESTAIATLDEVGEIINPAVLDSGSTPVGLTATLSSDVVLADSLQGSLGTLTIIDRRGTDVITRLEMNGPVVLGQVNVAPSTSDFSTNPQDLEFSSSTSAWVSRYEVNLEPEAAGLELGNDVVEIDLTNFSLTGRRIDLSRFNGPSDNGLVYARPALMALRGSTLVVAMERLAIDFRSALPGKLALIDLAGNGTVLDPQEFSLPDTVRNCGRVQPVPGTEDLVLVSCQGFALDFFDIAPRRASSGVFLIRIDGPNATLLNQFRPSDDPALPLSMLEALPLDETTFVAVEYGFVSGGGDRVYAVDFMSGAYELVVESSTAFTLGSMAFDPESKLLIVPDSAEDGGIRRFRRQSAIEFEPEETITFADGPLPPTRAYLLPQ